MSLKDISGPSIFWYDFETTGISAKYDRVVQLGAQRTNEELEPIDDPITLYCKLSNDILPNPDSCMITGITPQKALRLGVNEAQFSAQLVEQLAHPRTCAVGYNSIRFDDEFTRYLLYRNLHDPYAREWQNGNSRWDLLDVVRLTYALRPKGIDWPMRDDGFPSFRLEDLAAANNLEHESAHDAMSDVNATIALARLIREKQTKLYDYVFANRGKEALSQLLSVRNPKPVIHCSALYSRENGYIAPVIPIGVHPKNKNGMIVFNLRYSPEDYMNWGMSKLESVIGTKGLEESDRLPVNLIYVNRCPVVVPLTTINDKICKRYHIDLAHCLDSVRMLQHAKPLVEKLKQIYSKPYDNENEDVDHALYSGGFFSHRDRARMDALRALPPEELAQDGMSFDDNRLTEMLFRYRARNYPDTLTAEEMQRWNQFRSSRLLEVEKQEGINWPQYKEKIEAYLAEGSMEPDKIKLLQELLQYGEKLVAGIEAEVAGAS